MKRLGVFGGRFDPPHIAHLIHARLTLEKFDLDKILFIPAANPPHKQVHAPFADRARMVELAIKNDSDFDISRIEWKEDIIYTIDTLRRLKSLYPRTQLFLIIGRDEYDCLHTWRAPNRILEMVDLVVLPRGTKTEDSSKPGIRFPNLPLLEISSSRIRKRIAVGKTIRNWVAPRVETYIKNEQLYKESS